MQYNTVAKRSLTRILLSHLFSLFRSIASYTLAQKRSSNLPSSNIGSKNRNDTTGKMMNQYLSINTIKKNFIISFIPPPRSQASKSIYQFCINHFTVSLFPSSSIRFTCSAVYFFFVALSYFQITKSQPLPSGFQPEHPNPFLFS